MTVYLMYYVYSYANMTGFKAITELRRSCAAR